MGDSPAMFDDTSCGEFFIGQCTVAQQMLADFLHSKVGDQ